jgi:hypothetical protein
MSVCEDETGVLPPGKMFRVRRNTDGEEGR